MQIPTRVALRTKAFATVTIRLAPLRRSLKFI